MSERWFVRVEGKEYGPVGITTLREWQADGRLIAQNYLRRQGETAWMRASENMLLFSPEEPTVAPADPLAVQRTLPGIIRETFRIYGQGFPQFFALALLVAIPSFGINLSLAFVQVRAGQPMTPTARIAIGVVLAMLALLLVAWPIFIGGLQFAVAEISAGRPIKLGEVLRRARSFWLRVVRVGLFVYGSFLFWTALPLLAVLLVAARPSVISFFVAVFALVFQVYMAGRLFINFMFWQQTVTLGGLEGAEALRESKELARSGTRLPRWQRPLYRGAILASLWLGVFLLCSAAVELPFLMWRLRGMTSLEEAVAMMQALVNSPAPDRLTIVSYALSTLVHAFLRPLLGIAFVVLYFDAKSRR